jgi:hypothetical protein
MEEEVVQQQQQPPSHQESDLHLKMLVQPDDVQVKRVGRASCIEPELKVCMESDALYPMSVTLNAYLKVLGKDNKHKMILLRKSDEVMMTKVHRREVISMKLRFLKTIKVQVLKRNLGVARPEASVVFEAVNRHGEVIATMSTSHFAIISDPRYLDEVKKRRVGEKGDHDGVEVSDDDAYQPPTMRKVLKRRRLQPVTEYEGPLSYVEHSSLADGVDPFFYEASSSSPAYPSSPSSPSSSPSPSSSVNPYLYSTTPIYLTPLQTLRNISDFELFADSEEEYKLIKLVESLKYGGCSRQSCNFQVLPSIAQT